MEENQAISKRRYLIAFLVAAAACAVSWFFLTNTPTGCFNKIFAVGSSVCHQLPTHSFSLNTIQFPLCARCTGLYMGSLIGLVYAFASGRKAGIPRKGYLIMLGIFFIVWGADGVNSGISEFLNRPFLYQTTNLLRLITGYGMGLLMATALSTLFNSTIWGEKEDEPVLDSPIQVIIYFLLCGIVSLPYILGNEFIFTLNGYLAISSAISVITLLYTVFWVILLKKENHFSSWKSAWLFLLGGFTSAMLQIILLTTLRAAVL